MNVFVLFWAYAWDGDADGKLEVAEEAYFMKCEKGILQFLKLGPGVNVEPTLATGVSFESLENSLCSQTDQYEYRHGAAE
jgi:hypothetical protein